ncbi:MAG: biopolymer transporter ExbD [Marinicaulis sp.]|nr:biopolymer transporter ExbD [Marinicaulis sp.]NNE41987.1 biopolymer transporter ExbD [Marinicaulis sp.]NNL89032.1 biopolymer transporter ExbD [Marinicaulis sp.]
MRRRATHQDGGAEVNITPLLDIVFILLIFFIVTATFLREKGIDVRTPESDEQDEQTTPPPALVLAVQDDGFVRINNVRIIDPGSVKPVVQEFVAREPNGVVLVSAAPESESGIAVQVMDQAQDGGARAVSLALQQEQQ